MLSPFSCGFTPGTPFSSHTERHVCQVRCAPAITLDHSTGFTAGVGPQALHYPTGFNKVYFGLSSVIHTRKEPGKMYCEMYKSDKEKHIESTYFEYIRSIAIFNVGNI